MTREKFEYAIKSCGYFTYFGQKYYEESELIKAFDDMGLIEQEPCDDAEQIDYHDDFETALMKIHDYEERQKQNDKKCGNCKLIGTDSCYMVCGGSKSLYKTKQKSEPCDDVVSRAELLKAIDTWDKFGYTETGCFVREPKGDYVAYVHYDDVIKCIKGMPSVRPQEPTGHWIIDKGSLDALYGEVCICSECGVESIGESDFCPNCGCAMKGE